MENKVQNTIKRLLDEKGLNVSEAEYESGLKRNSLRNILLGKSQNPGANTLLRISETLGCSIYDLFEYEPYQNKYFDNAIDKPELYLSALSFVIEHFSKKELKLTSTKLFSLANQIYSYSITNDLGSIDEKFVNWLIENDPDGSS